MYGQEIVHSAYQLFWKHTLRSMFSSYEYLIRSIFFYKAKFPLDESSGFLFKPEEELLCQNSVETGEH